MNNDDIKPSLIIVMGVSGTGKSSLAKMLADSLGYRFVEADDFHDAEAKAQMSNNISLTDGQRQQWIERLCSSLSQLGQHRENIVLAYSGLKKRHRMQFRQLPFEIDLILLKGDQRVIASRMSQRKGHFVDASFLIKQLQDMEWPAADELDIHHLDIGCSIEEMFRKACLLLSKHNQKDALFDHL